MTDAILAFDGDRINPNRTSFDSIMRRARQDFAWLEEKAASPTDFVANGAVMRLAVLSIMCIEKLKNIEKTNPELIKDNARRTEWWPYLLTNDPATLKDIKNTLKFLELGKSSAFTPVNRQKVKRRQSTIKVFAGFLAEIIDHCTLIKAYAERLTRQKTKNSSPLDARKNPKAIVEYFKLDTEATLAHLERHKATLLSQLALLSEVLNVANPFQTLEAFHEHFAVCSILPALDSGSAEQWYETAKTLIFAFTDKPELSPVLRPIGEHRSKHYESTDGSIPVGSRESNIQIRILERLKSAFAVIAKK